MKSMMIRYLPKKAWSHKIIYPLLHHCNVILPSVICSISNSISFSIIDVYCFINQYSSKMTNNNTPVWCVISKMNHMLKISCFSTNCDSVFIRFLFLLNFLFGWFRLEYKLLCQKWYMKLNDVMGEFSWESLWSNSLSDDIYIFIGSI
jgi:hypothetical protein